MKFSRLILYKVVSSRILEENSRVIYLMEARNQNKKLWNKNVNHRDNSEISIGSIIRLLCPMPIEAYMRCDVPLVISHQPAILMKTPRILENVRMSNEFEANTSLAFYTIMLKLLLILLQLLKNLDQEIFVTGKEFQIGMVSKDAVIVVYHLIAQA